MNVLKQLFKPLFEPMICPCMRLACRVSLALAAVVGLSGCSSYRPLHPLGASAHSKAYNACVIEAISGDTDGELAELLSHYLAEEGVTLYRDGVDLNEEYFRLRVSYLPQSSQVNAYRRISEDLEDGNSDTARLVQSQLRSESVALVELETSDGTALHPKAQRFSASLESDIIYEREESAQACNAPGILEPYDEATRLSAAALKRKLARNIAIWVGVMMQLK